MPARRVGHRSAGRLSGRRRRTAADAHRARAGSGVRPTGGVAAFASDRRRGADRGGHGAGRHGLRLAVRGRRRVRARGGVDHPRRSRGPHVESLGQYRGRRLMEGALHGYTVVELSTGIAGSYCTKLLADGGARVIKVEPPHGDPLRRWSASGADIDGDGALFAFLAGGKHSVVAEAGDAGLVHDLLAAADAVVWSRGSAVAGSFTPTALRESHPHLVVTSITPFGLKGPWCDRP